MFSQSPNDDPWNVFNLDCIITSIPHVISMDMDYRNVNLTISCGYKEDEKIIIDGIKRFYGKIDPLQIVIFLEKYIQILNVTTFVYIIDTFKMFEFENINFVKHLIDENTIIKFKKLNKSDKLDITYHMHSNESFEFGNLKLENSNDLSNSILNCVWYLDKLKI